MKHHPALACYYPARCRSIAWSWWTGLTWSRASSLSLTCCRPWSYPLQVLMCFNCCSRGTCLSSLLYFWSGLDSWPCIQQGRTWILFFFSLLQSLSTHQLCVNCVRMHCFNWCLAFFLKIICQQLPHSFMYYFLSFRNQHLSKKVA